MIDIAFVESSMDIGIVQVYLFQKDSILCIMFVLHAQTGSIF